MSPDSGKDFDRNMNQLVRLLKKIIKNLPFGQIPQQQYPFSKDKESGININFCFFNFLPMTEEEMEEMDAIYDQFLTEEEEKATDFSPDLSPSDMDFLRRNGLRF